MTSTGVTGHRGASTAVLVVGGGGLAMMVVAIIGAIVSAARNHGDIGGYGVVCFVGGVTYAVSLFVLKRRG